MAVQAIYSIGTVSVTAGSATVVGSGTAFALVLVNGGSLSVKGRSIPIVGVSDDTHLTLAYAAPADMAGNAQPYAIELGRAEIADSIRSNRLLAELVDTLGSKVTPFARSLLDDPDAASVLASLGVSAFVRALLDDPDAATARTTIGASAKASELFAYTMAQRFKYGPNADISWEGLEAAALQLESDPTTPGAAGLLLHRLGSFACYFGLDKLNRLAVGGRSFGAASHAIWHDGLVAKSLAVSGYQKDPSGLITQWGIAPLTTSNNVDYGSTVSFPMQFPNAVARVVAGGFTAPSSGDARLLGTPVVTANTAQMNVAVRNNFNATPISGAGVPFIATGY